MKCKKDIDRDIYNLFTVYQCLNCENLFEDEFIKIGYRLIGIYNFKKCSFDNLLLKEKFMTFLLECIKYNDKIILLWGEENLVSSNYEALNSFLDNGYDIQIINY